jgi:hypothetical protein
MDVRHTQRGFEIVEFHDIYDAPCSLQQSSLAGAAVPGGFAVWLGVGEHRMHLDADLVEELISLLQNWIHTGSFEEE